MALLYCFERPYIKQALGKCKCNDLAVVDTEGHEKAVREAVSRGVFVYGYLNVGALENGSSGEYVPVWTGDVYPAVMA